MTKKCCNCQSNVDENDQFCSECGAELAAYETANNILTLEDQQDINYGTLTLQGFEIFTTASGNIYPKINSAKNLFKRAIVIDPERPDAFLGLAWCHASLGEYRGALNNIELTASNLFNVDPAEIHFEITSDNNNPDETNVYEIDLDQVIMFRASFHLYLGNVGQAEEDLNAVFDALPEEYAAEKNAWRAEIYFMRDDMENACRCLGDSLMHDPECIEAHFLRGQMFLSNGDADNAISALSHTLNIDPAHPDALLARAKAYAAVGKIDEMKDDIKVARQIIDNGYADVAIAQGLDVLTKMAAELHNE